MYFKISMKTLSYFKQYTVLERSVNSTFIVDLPKFKPYDCHYIIKETSELLSDNFFKYFGNEW